MILPFYHLIVNILSCIKLYQLPKETEIDLALKVLIRKAFRTCKNISYLIYNNFHNCINGGYFYLHFARKTTSRSKVKG